MVKSNYEMMDDVKDMVEMYIDEYNEKYNSDVPIPPVHFKVKGRVAGYHYFDLFGHVESSELGFNLDIMKLNYDEFVFQTVGHEVAHHICFVLFGNQYTKGGRRISHGDSWKMIMSRLGLDVKRCHNYQLPEKTVKKRRLFEYTCECDSYNLGIKRHNKVQRGKGSYYCKKCKADLSYNKELLPGEV